MYSSSLLSVRKGLQETKLEQAWTSVLRSESDPVVPAAVLLPPASFCSWRWLPELLPWQWLKSREAWAGLQRSEWLSRLLRMRHHSTNVLTRLTMENSEKIAPDGRTCSSISGHLLWQSEKIWTDQSLQWQMDICSGFFCLIWRSGTSECDGQAWGRRRAAAPVSMSVLFLSVLGREQRAHE